MVSRPALNVAEDKENSTSDCIQVNYRSHCHVTILKELWETGACSLSERMPMVLVIILSLPFSLLLEVIRFSFRMKSVETKDWKNIRLFSIVCHGKVRSLIK